MSCISPIYIANPRINYRRGIDRKMLAVPCNHCVGCHRRVIDDWYVRLRAELEDYQKKGGCCYFATLTYNEDMLPYLDTKSIAPIVNRHLRDHYIQDKFRDDTFTEDLRVLERKKFTEIPILPTQPCFDKSHIVKFQKSLRQLVKQRHNVDGLKFFTVCEYGDHTLRPHYHVLIFSPHIFHESMFMELMELAWSIEVRDKNIIPERVQAVASHLHLSGSCHTKVSYYTDHEIQWIVSKNSKHRNYHFHQRYGNIKYSDNYGAFVTFAPGILYLLEYMFKQESFYNGNYDLENAVHALPSADDCKMWFPDYVCDMIKFLKGSLPFRHSSQNLGISLINELDEVTKTATGYDCSENFNPEDVFKAKISYPNQLQKSYSFPVTLANRLLRFHEPYFDIDGKRKFHVRMSPLATKCADWKLNNQLVNTSKFYEFVLSDAFVALADKISRKTIGGEMFSYWLAQAREFGPAKLSIYNCLYKDVDYSVSKTMCNIFDRFESYAFNVGTYNLDNQEYHESYEFFLSETPLRDLQKFTKDFDKMDNCLDFISNLFGEVSLRQFLKSQEDKNEKYRLRDIYNNLNFNNLKRIDYEQMAKIF